MLLEVIKVTSMQTSCCTHTHTHTHTLSILLVLRIHIFIVQIMSLRYFRKIWWSKFILFLNSLYRFAIPLEFTAGWNVDALEAVRKVQLSS